MKKQPRTQVTHFRKDNFKTQNEKTVNPTKTCIQKILRKRKFYVHEITAVNLSNIYVPQNVKKTCKPNNRDLNRD